MTQGFTNQINSVFTVDHNPNGSHKQITDINGNVLIDFSITSSAVNKITVKNASTGNSPEIQATGSDTNINLKLVTKGTGEVLMPSFTSSDTTKFVFRGGSKSISTSYTTVATISLGSVGYVYFTFHAGFDEAGIGSFSSTQSGVARYVYPSSSAITLGSAITTNGGGAGNSINITTSGASILCQVKANSGTPTARWSLQVMGSDFTVTKN